MAAPSATQWGAAIGSGNRLGRIGVNVYASNTNTTTTIYMDIWFWSKYSVSDSSNTFRYSFSNTSIVTIGSKSINHTVNTGTGWSANNQTLIGTYSSTFNRLTYDYQGSCTADFYGIEAAGGGATGTVTAYFTIPAKPSYTVSYNANGGSGAPGAQTKYYGETLKLSSTKPTRIGYTFQGWGTSSGGDVSYAPGANYTSNSSVTLYAVWKALTYTVSYNANGGSGAPGAQTKTYGVNLTLSSTRPTRTNYNFKGWGTSAGSTTVAYAPGATYTTNAAVTLYAVWELAYAKPRINNLTVDRCTSSGALNDDGTYLKVAFKWATDKSIASASCYIEYVAPKWNGSVERYSLSGKLSGTSGTASFVIGGGGISTEYAWDATVHLQDASGSNDAMGSVSSAYYIMDFRSGGNGIAFGESAGEDGFVVNMAAKFRKTLSAAGTSTFSGASTFGSTAKFDGAATFGSTARFNGATTFVGNETHSGYIYDRYGNEIRSEVDQPYIKAMTVGAASGDNVVSGATMLNLPYLISNTSGGLLAQSGGGIKIGTGITAVLVSASVFAYAPAIINDYMWASIQIVRGGISIEQFAAISGVTSGGYSSVNIPSALMAVQAGDIIKIKKINTESFTIRGLGNTYLTVQIAQMTKRY